MALPVCSCTHEMSHICRCMVPMSLPGCIAACTLRIPQTAIQHIAQHSQWPPDHWSPASPAMVTVTMRRSKHASWLLPHPAQALAALDEHELGQQGSSVTVEEGDSNHGANGASLRFT